MSLEYAPKGLVGLLTPQANTTAEIEFNALMPLGVSSLVARMTSRCSTLEARLLEYFDQLDLTLEQFANAPLAERWMALEAAWAMTMKGAWLYDNGRACGPEANAAKFLGGRAAHSACETASNIFSTRPESVELPIIR